MLTREQATQTFHYNPSTGVIVRVSTPRPQTARYVGQAIGYKNSNGYVVVSVKARRYRAHHVAWVIMTGEWPTGFDIDHINGDRTDNRWENLRVATRSENLCNQRLRNNNTSGIKGVTFDRNRKKWLAQISVNKQRVHLGRFDSKKDAAQAYAKAAQKHHGRFSRVIDETAS